MVPPKWHVSFKLGHTLRVYSTTEITLQCIILDTHASVLAEILLRAMYIHRRGSIETRPHNIKVRNCIEVPQIRFSCIYFSMQSDFNRIIPAWCHHRSLSSRLCFPSLKSGESELQRKQKKTEESTRHGSAAAADLKNILVAHVVQLIG